MRYIVDPTFMSGKEGDSPSVSVERSVPSPVGRVSGADPGASPAEKSIDVNRRFSSIPWNRNLGTSVQPPPPPSDSGCAPGWTEVTDGQWKRTSCESMASALSLVPPQTVLSTASIGATDSDALAQERVTRTLERVRKQSTPMSTPTSSIRARADADNGSTELTSTRRTSSEEPSAAMRI